MADNIKLGVSLYSLSSDFVKERKDLEACLQAVAAMGFTGIEIVAAQMVPGYPNPSDGWLAHFGELLARYGLSPVCWSAYIDMGMRSDRDMTDEEIIQFTTNDLIYAKKAGFGLVRTQHSISPRVFEAMVPVCRALDIRLGIEMHHPHHPRVPVWQQYLELMHKHDCLVAVPDLGIFQARPHRLLVERLIRAGFRPDKLDDVLAAHAAGSPAQDTAGALALTPQEAAFTEQLYEKFCPTPVEDLAVLIPVSPYIHGKFYILDDGEYDPCVPYDRLLPEIKRLGFSGYIAAEYEGHHFDMSVDVDEQLRRYASIFHKYLA